jgi:SSS family solute:Na+ symporter
MTTGAIVGLLGVLAQAFWPSLTLFHAAMPEFPLNGVQIALTAYLASITVFVVLSLLTCKEPFDLERLLHRGKYAVSEDHAPRQVTAARHIPAWMRRLGVNADFSTGDRVIYFAQMGWTAFWLLAFLGGTAAAVTIGLSDPVWLGWWKFVVVLTICVGVLTVFWFLIGGIRDFRDLARRLRAEQPDAANDGWVSGNSSN